MKESLKDLEKSKIPKKKTNFFTFPLNRKSTFLKERARIQGKTLDFVTIQEKSGLTKGIIFASTSNQVYQQASSEKLNKFLEEKQDIDEEEQLEKEKEFLIEPNK